MRDLDKKSIERLFDDEVLHPEPPVPSKELKEIKLTPSPEALAASKEGPKPKINWEERREFNRAEVIGQQIVLQFSNDAQFAKQYVENISLGGLFVRTKLRPGLGALMSIQFAVPRVGNEPKSFQLQARVCRETDAGLGLQFINLSNEMRSELEEVVRVALPEGKPLTNQVKKSSLDHLEQIREAKETKDRQRLKALKVSVLIAALLILNVYMGLQLSEGTQQDAAQYVRPSIEIGEKSIHIDQIRSIGRHGDGKIDIQMNNGEIFTVDSKEIESAALPSYLRETFRLVQSFEAPKQIRRTKNPHRSLQ